MLQDPAVLAVAGCLVASWAWMAQRFIKQLDATTKLASRTAEALDRIATRLERLERIAEKAA